MVKIQSSKGRYWALKNLALLLLAGLPTWLLLRLILLVLLEGEWAAEQWLGGILFLAIVLAPLMLVLGVLQLLTLWILCRFFPTIPARIWSVASVAVIPLGYVVLSRGELGVLGSADFLVALLVVLAVYALLQALPPNAGGHRDREPPKVFRSDI